MEKECEFQFLDLHLTLEPKLTLKPKVNFLELVLVPEPIILEPKLTIPPSHIFLLDIALDHDDFVMIFQDWSCKGSKFQDRIFHDPIHIGDCKYVNRKEVNKGRLCESPYYLDLVATLDPIIPLPEPPPLGNIFLSILLFHASMH